MDESHLAQVRRFNRLVTRRIGVLTDDYLGRGRPLAESRLLFEVGRDGADVRALRERLGLDSGYASRLLRALEAQGLIAVRAAAHDARVRRVSLTRKGQREVDALDRHSQSLASALLSPLGQPQREKLVAAMAEVERLLRASAVELTVVAPDSAEAVACVNAYLQELNQRFEGGFDPALSVSAEPDELRMPHGAFLIAWLDGQAIGCGGLKRIAPGIGEIKRMWVAPEARGLGVAQRLLDALHAQARTMELDIVRLDTNRTLTEARALYARNGYGEIAAYNDNPYAHHWFEKRGVLTGP